MKVSDSYEKVVTIDVEIDRDGNPASPDNPNKQKVTRFVVSDTHPDVQRVAHFRTGHPLHAYNAWTHFQSGAQWYMTEAEARDGLFTLWGERFMGKGIKKGPPLARVREPDGCYVQAPNDPDVALFVKTGAKRGKIVNRKWIGRCMEQQNRELDSLVYRMNRNLLLTTGEVAEMLAPFRKANPKIKKESKE